jgi:hypothetical protein
MTDQSKWEELQQSWQAQPDHPMPKLAKLLKRRSWIIWAMTATDAIGTLVMVTAAIWVLGHKPTDFETEIAIVVLVAVVATWTIVLIIRRGTWHLETAAPAAMLDLSIRRCRASIMLATMTQYSVLAAVVYGLVSRFLLQHGSVALSIDPGIKTLLRLASVLLLVGMLAGAQWYKKRKRTEVERLQALRAELGMEP